MDNLSLKSFFNDIYFLIIAYVYYLFNIPFKATIIVGVDAETNAIGFENTLIFNVKSDMKHFKETTSSKKNSNVRNVLICGRVTYESIGLTILPKRNMIVITKNIEFDKEKLESCSIKSRYLNSKTKIYELNTGEELIFISDVNKIENVISYLSYKDCGVPKIFIIGGAKIYNLFLDNYIPNISVGKCIITEISNENKSFFKQFRNRYDTVFSYEKVKSKYKLYNSKILENGVIVKYYK